MSADTTQLELLTANPLAELVAILDRLDCHSYTLHATDRTYYGAQNPAATVAQRVELRLTIVGRTHFEALCAALGAKPTERVVRSGQRSWWAEADTDDRRLLIEGVSFQHHDDWQPRTKEGAC